MASVRKRTWKAATGELKTAWIVDYADRAHRQRKHFQTKKLPTPSASPSKVNCRRGFTGPLLTR